MGEYVVVPNHGDIPAQEFLAKSPHYVDSKLSANYLITPAGTLVQLVPETECAHHAGQSRWLDLGGDDGYPGLNRWSYGAEWLVAGVWEYQVFRRACVDGSAKFTPEQYRSGGYLYARWMIQDGIPRQKILAHSQVAGDHVRGVGKGKRDPGAGFDWDEFWRWVDRWFEIGV